MTKVRLTHGMRQLLDDDPCSFLLYAVEQVQDQAHHRRLGRVLRHLQRRTQEIGWVHVSDLTQPCERTIAAHLLGIELPREELTPQKSRIYENGTYMHLRYYNYFLSLPPPFNVQVAVIVKFWPVIGEADIVVQHPELGWQIIELKSMNTDQFKLLKEPTLSHQAQLNGYLALFGNNAQGQIWYENKNTQDVKTYVYPYNLEAFQTAYSRVLEVAKGVLVGTLPPTCGCATCDIVGFATGIDEKIEKLALVIQREASDGSK